MPHTLDHIDTTVLDARARQLGSDTITASDLTSSERFPFVNPNPEGSPVFPVAGLNAEAPQLPETREENIAQGFSTELQGLFGQLEGESAEQARQEDIQGLPAQLQAQQDLSGRLSALQAEATALPLQIQQESIGRGRTRGGVAPIQTARLRENAIQALSVSSLLEASRGNIALSQSLADRAVAQKFDPIREEIATAQANLQLVLQSPSFSRAEKNRALQTEVALQDRQRQIEREASNETAKRNFAAMGAEMGNIPQAVLSAILEPETTFEEAFGAVAPFIADRAREDRNAQDSLRNLEFVFQQERIKDLRFQRAERAVQAIQAQELAESEAATENEAATEKALGIRDLIEGLQTAKGFSAAVGKGFKKSIVGKIPFVSGEAGPGSARADFEAKATQLRDLLTLDNLKLMSGILTDKDIEILSNAASTLGNFDQSEKQYNEELTRMLSVVNRVISEVGLTDEQHGFWNDLNPEDLLEVGSAFGGSTTPQATFTPSAFFE